jgi:hypothetical protein
LTLIEQEKEVLALQAEVARLMLENDEQKNEIEKL